MTRQEAIERASDDTVLMFIEDKAFDDAIVGVSTNNAVVYSYQKMIEGYMNTYGADYSESLEHIDFNCVGAVITGTENPPPIIIDDL